MKGVRYIVDDAGKRRSVIIDLSEWSDLWEELLDVMVSRTREREPTVPLRRLKAQLASHPKQRG